jgi:hypothetical protein
VHFKEILSLCGAIVAAVALVSASGASTAKTHKIARIDVSSRSAIVHYLRSIHVNPKGFVVQRGLHNYAGPRCPGTRWSCTRTTHPVVQVAPAEGRNRFSCVTARCAVVQVAPASAPTTGNVAACIKTTGLGQSCTISQSSSAGNMAGVYEDSTKKSGLTQTASFSASITQTASSGDNTACVHQVITMDGSTNLKGTKASPINVALEAHQTITITQDSVSGHNYATHEATPTPTLTGPNPNVCTDARLNQTQSLTSTAGGSGAGQVTQNENLANTGANMSLDIEQNQHSANGSLTSTGNDATFTQTNNLSAVAYTPASGSVSQTQSSTGGGILAKVNQDANGISNADAKQVEMQCEDAYAQTTIPTTGCSTTEHAAPTLTSLTQNQFGPVEKAPGDSTQTGNENCTPGVNCDSFLVNQTSQQDSDAGSTQTNKVSGGFSTTGSGTVTQTTDVNGTPDTNTQSGSTVDTTTNCTGSNCTTTCSDASCTTFTQNGAQLTATDTEVKEFGYGGMRAFTGTGNPNVGDGTGSIAVSGITGPVSKALLFWNGPTSSADPASNADVSFAENPITGTNIGTAASNCWGAANGGPYTNSQSYVADVTSIVGSGLVSGSGTFGLANFIKTDINNTVVADINGVALVVFYNDGNAANWRNVVLWSGNDSNVLDEQDTADVWDETLTGVPWPGSGSASLDFIVGDGQDFGGDSTDDGAISVNGTEIVPEGGIFQGASTPAGPGYASGDLWDVESFSLPSTFLSTLTTGSNTLHVTAPHVNDCLSLVAVAANMPASAPPPVLQAPIAPAQKQAVSPIGQVPAPVSAFGGGGALSGRK